ncbi:MAG TPA: hypothetical protein VLA90_01865 [Actinomycetota bacterium]|nr:hypothetical protein [Actinomycetota bacterium]
MALDERLRRELDSAGRPADPTGVYEELIRHRERRRMVRKAQHGALAIVIVFGTIGGAYAASSLFRPSDGAPGIQPEYANGLIVYAKHDSTAGGVHLYAVDVDGSNVRQLTHGESADHDPSWSPDGRRIAFVRETGADRFIAVLDIGSGTIRRVTPATITAFEPAWSPDGQRIVFVGYEDPFRDGGLFALDADGSDLTRITESLGSVGHPVWSDDGLQIAFSANPQDDPDTFNLYLVQPDGTRLWNITQTRGLQVTEVPIGWLPSGNLLVAQGPTLLGGLGEAAESVRWIEITPDGDVVRVRFEGAATAERRNTPSLSPDGRYVIFDTEVEGRFSVWYMDLETGELSRVTRDGGFGAVWQPVPIDEQVSPAPEPTPKPSPTASGRPVDRRIRDVGLGLRLCDVSSLRGTFLAEYPESEVFVGAEPSAAGRCPLTESMSGVIAIDLSGDGLADIASEPFACQYQCGAFAAPDIDGDGTDEILAINVGFSIVGLQLFDVVPNEDEPAIVAVMVEPPGDAALGHQGFDGSGPPQFWIGGDAFVADAIRCESVDGRRTLVSTTVRMVPPDTPDSVWEVHETMFVLEGDGILRVVDAADFEVPVGSESPGFLATTGCDARMVWP